MTDEPRQTEKTEKPTGNALLDSELAGYGPRSVTVRALEALLKVLPEAPALPTYSSISECASLVYPDVPEDVVHRAIELADDKSVDQALFAAKSLDAGDTGLSILTGIRSAMSLVLGAQGPGRGAKGQQSADAALKALGLAYVLTRLLPTEPAERVRIIKTIPAGQELLLYYGAIEIALPFAEEVASAEGNFVHELVERRSRAMAGKLLGIAGKQGVADAQETLKHLTATLDEVADFVVPHTGALVDSLRSVLPGVLGTGPHLTDVVAAGADALPCYRYLCARVAAESRLALAKLELMPELDMPELPSEQAPAPVAAPPPIPAALAAAGLGANPFAPMAGPVVDAPPPPPAPAPEPEPWPTEELPADERLNGVFGRSDGDEHRWLVFTATGLHTTTPPSAPPPVDWDAHVAAGHAVARYGRYGNQVDLRWPDGRTERLEVDRDTYTLTARGAVWQRMDFSLTGQVLDGTWVAEGRDPLAFAPDGSVHQGDRAGTYALAVGSIAITWPEGTERWSLFSTLQPSVARADVLWLAGTCWTRQA